MKTLTLPLATLAFLSLAACGERNGPPPPEAGSDQIADTGAVDAHRGEPGPPAEDADQLLDRVGMASDDTYEPEITSDDVGSMQLDGPLAEGEWRDLGARGVGFARTGFEPVATFRCAADESGLIVAVSAPAAAGDGSAEGEEAADETAAPDDAAGDEDASAEGDAAATPPAGAAGSLITAGGMATGRFEPAEGDPSSWEMLVPANDPALTGLGEEGRIAVSLEGEETRRMELSPMAVERISACGGEADPDEAG